MQIEQFVNNIKTVYGDNLESIILFGSAATKDFSKQYSDYNLIVVLKKITPNELAKANRTIQGWVKSGNPLPLFFDPQHIKTSADVFPIEFYDIKSSRKILFGTDTFTSVTIDNKNLRHQCESELKGKLLQLKSRFALVSDKDKEISRLMMKSLSAFLSVFKGIVRLLGHEPEITKRALVEQLSTMIDCSPNIFMELLDIRDGTAILPRKNATEKIEDYLAQLGIIANFIDQYQA